MDIEELNKLEKLYRNLMLDVTKVNSNEGIDAYHRWYDAAVVFLSDYFTDNDPDYKFFKDVDNSGNGYTLKENYRSISSRYNLLLHKAQRIIDSKNVSKQNNSSNMQNGMALIFVSHSSKDKEVVKIFVDEILKAGLRFEDSEIVFTSEEATGVETGENVPTFIIDNIRNCSVFLSMVSPQYAESAICMNEVGAALALGKKPCSVLLPNADYKHLGWLVNLDKAARADDDESVDSLMETICNKCGKTVPKPKSWNPVSKKYFAALNTYLSTNKVNANSNECCLVFDNGEKEIIVSPHLRLWYYQTTNNGYNSNNNQNYSYNTLVKATVSIVRGTKYLSRAPINLSVNNDSESVDDVEVILCSDDICFHRVCEEHTFSVLPINVEYAISEDLHTLSCSLGSINTRMKKNMKTFYLEFPSLYGEYDNSLVHSDLSQLNLTSTINYTISTRQKRYDGKLVVHIKPNIEYKPSTDKALMNKCLLESVEESITH